MIVKGVLYYDVCYERIIRVNAPAVWGLMRERCEKVSPHIVGESVLDVACGLGMLAECGKPYTGVDFSPVALNYAGEQYSASEFIEADVYEFLAGTERRFDTVVLMEILEHVAHPAELYELAASVANERVILTVPRDLRAPAHVWPTWPPESIDLLLSMSERSQRAHKELFGGEDGQRWWLVVQDLLDDETIP